MQFDSLAFIIAAEVAAVLLIFCIVLGIQNRSLRGVIKKLQERMNQLTENRQIAKASRAPPSETQHAPTELAEKNYIDLIEAQLETTRNHHATLEPNQDIVLDLAPDTELPRRAAALRYAVLLAEKEAYKSAQHKQESLNWQLLQSKYNQLFDFYEDYKPDQKHDGDDDTTAALNQELLNAKKRLSNLEKFKNLYFELEEKWENSKKNAQEHYQGLSSMASQVEDSEKFTTALESYYAAFDDIGKLINTGVEGGEKDLLENDSKGLNEIHQLRAVAADQHRIIAQLEEKLKNASSDEEKHEALDLLKDELDKQKRFIKESETCIQLMEDELNSVKKELDQVKSRLKRLPGLKAELQDAVSQRDNYESKVYSLTSENRTLKKKLQESNKNGGSEDLAEAQSLKEQLGELETRYADLEEKYLELKVNQ